MASPHLNEAITAIGAEGADCTLRVEPSILAYAVCGRREAGQWIAARVFATLARLLTSVRTRRQLEVALSLPARSELSHALIGNTKLVRVRARQGD